MQTLHHNKKKIVTKDRDGNVIDIKYGGKGEGRVGIAGDKHSYEWGHLTNPYKYSEKVRGTFLGEQRTADGEHISTTYQVRENPMDWKAYTNDELYRATMDELLEKDYMMFMGPGSDFDNARQVRAASKEIQSWVNEHYDKAREEGRDGASAEAEWQKDKALQIARAKIHNVRYPEGKNTRGYQHNQQVQIRKYQPWNKFDPDTGTRTKVNPVTGEVRDSFTHKPVTEPTRMMLTGDVNQQDVDEGIFYSPTVALQDKIENSMLEKPPKIAKPNLTIRSIGTPKRTENVPSDWAMKGGTT